MSPPPRAPGTARPAIHRHLLELLPTAKQERMVAAILTTPEGVLRSAARSGVYPKFLISVAENVEMTPLEIAICERAKKKKKKGVSQFVSTGRHSIGTHQHGHENQKNYLYVQQEFLDV